MSLRDSEEFQKQLNNTRHPPNLIKPKLIEFIQESLYHKAVQAFHTFCYELALKNSNNVRTRFIFRGSSYPLVPVTYLRASGHSHIPTTLQEEFVSEFLNRYSEYNEMLKESGFILNQLATLVQETDSYLDFISLMPPSFSADLSSAVFTTHLAEPAKSEEDLDILRSKYKECLDLIHNRMTINLLTGY